MNLSLDEYITKRAITGPTRPSRGRGNANRVQSAPTGRRPLAGRIGKATPSSSNVKPLMKIAAPRTYDARQKILEKVRQGDARDKIIMKNRTKFKDARDKIGMPQQKQEQLGPPQNPPSRELGQFASASRGAIPLMMASNTNPFDAGQMEDLSPRKRSDARVFGHDNNIIVMAKNDYISTAPVGTTRAPSPPLDAVPRHGTPVVMIKNDRMRGDAVEQPRARANRDAPAAQKKVKSPRFTDAPLASRRLGPSVANQHRLAPPGSHGSSSSRSRSPLPPLGSRGLDRLTPRAQIPHYDSATDEEEIPAPTPETRRKPPVQPKRALPQNRQAARPEKPPRRGSPEPLPPRSVPPKTKSSSQLTFPSKSTKSSTSILHGIKPVTSSQIPRDPRTPPEATDKQSPIQGFRVHVSNLHSIVTQEDVVELFSACGALKRTKMIKPSIAEVVFVKREDAEMAVKKYNNRELDGQPMQCKMVTPSPKPVASTPSGSSEGPLLGGRLKPTSQQANGVEASTIHKALFNTAAGAASAGKAATKPVVFTVKI